MRRHRLQCAYPTTPRAPSYNKEGRLRTRQGRSKTTNEQFEGKEIKTKMQTNTLTNGHSQFLVQSLQSVSIGARDFPLVTDE